MIWGFFREWRRSLCVAALLALPGSVTTPAQTPPESTPDPAKPVPPNWPAPVHDNEVFEYVSFNQLEGRLSGPAPIFRWDGEGWIGTNKNKLWLKSEGNVTNGIMSDGDHEALYDRPIPHLRYFDWQAGVRADLDSGSGRTWAAIGIQGLAPYFFNFEPTFYVRDGGHVAGRLQGSYNLYVTQRVILQPQVEMNFYSKTDPARGIGTGLSDLDSGIRLGYQISRKFAPYLGFTYSSTFGETATFARRAGEPVHVSSLVLGIWIWR
jgi:copper resistance protein B